jgi:uncharacterized protein
MRGLAQAFVLVAAAAAPASAQQAAQPTRVIAVWGQGEASAAPDMAELSAGVVSEGRTAGAALAANSEAMEKVIAAAKGMGVAARGLQTAGIGVNPVYARPDRPGEPPRITGYRASNTLRIRLDDLDKLGALLDAVVAAGANMANGLSLGVADAAKIEDEAREAAMKDARRKAELLAKASGVALRHVVSISEEGAGRPVPLRGRAMATQSAAPVEPGETTVNATLRVVYAIE